MLGSELRQDSPFNYVQKAQVSLYNNLLPALRHNAVTSLVKIFPGIFRPRIECWENILRDSNNRADTRAYSIYFYSRIEPINRTFCDKLLNEAAFLQIFLSKFETFKKGKEIEYHLSI